MLDRRTFLAAAGAALGIGPARGQTGRPVTIFAAASLQTALGAVASALPEAQRYVASYASSAALARQLEQGAPADIFASADLEWMDWAEQRQLIQPATRRNLLGNSLVLIEPATAASGLRIAPGFGLAEALGGSRLAIGEPQSVPAGRYAREALTALGVWEAVRPRIAGVENVRAALALVARGEARYGIVYATDAKAEPRVRVVDTFPAATHTPIVYPFALTRQAGPGAAEVLSALASPPARSVFEANGFQVLG